MSRRTLEPFNPAHEVVVGWDPGLNTYFAIVQFVSVPDDQDPMIMWIGAGKYGDCPDPVEVLAKVAAFAVVPPTLLAELVADKADEGERDKSPFLLAMEAMWGAAER